MYFWLKIQIVCQRCKPSESIRRSCGTTAVLLDQVWKLKLIMFSWGNLNRLSVKTKSLSGGCFHVSCCNKQDYITLISCWMEASLISFCGMLSLNRLTLTRQMQRRGLAHKPKTLRWTKPAINSKVWCGIDCGEVTVKDGWLVTHLPARAELTLVDPFSCTEMEGTLEDRKQEQWHSVSKSSNKEPSSQTKAFQTDLSFRSTSQN